MGVGAETITLKKHGLPEGQLSEKFLQGMVTRCAMGFFKYGSTQENLDVVNMMSSAQMRIEEYIKTKNTEFLMDAANFLMFEFMKPSIPGAFYEPTDDDKSPGVRWK